MKEKNLIGRIIVDPAIMTGKPVIKGTRLTVQYILGLLAQGIGVDEILAEYSTLTKDDVLACLAFAQEALERTTFAPLAKS